MKLIIPVEELDAMGRVEADAVVTNSGDLHEVRQGHRDPSQVRRTCVRFLVDTGAAMICMPKDLIDQIGLYRIDEREALTANGRVRRSVYSPVEIEVMGRRVVLTVMELPVGTPPLLGYLALEALDLVPNPRAQRLEGNPAHDGEYIVDLL